MRVRAVVAAAAVASFLAGPLQAHEGHTHKTHKMMGTVSAVHADVNHVEIKTKDGKTSGFYVTPTTKYRKGSTVLSLGDLTAGTRVVVTARMEGDKMVASEVRVGGATKSATKATTS